MDWVEVHAKTVDTAVEAALADLGIESREHAQIEVLQEPERGFLGIGAKEAIVRVKAKPKPKRRRRSRSRSRSGGTDKSGASGGKSGGGDKGGRDQKGGRDDKGGRDQKGGRDDKGGRSSGKGGQKRGGRSSEGSQRGAGGQGGGERRKKSGAGGNGQQRSGRQKAEERMDKDQGKNEGVDNGNDTPSPEEQAQVVGEFLSGLLAAFGLEGDVDTRVEDGVIYADVTGEQTEALVGSKGSILQAILELSRTVVQRKTRSGARIRLDIAGYTARRREALKIYAQRLATQVRDDGEEIMLEPMNPADRKVVHDAVAEVEGVRSYSEGEEPNRSVVLGLAPGFEPLHMGEDESDDGASDTSDGGPEASVSEEDADASSDDDGSDDDADRDENGDHDDDADDDADDDKE